MGWFWGSDETKDSNNKGLLLHQETVNLLGDKKNLHYGTNKLLMVLIILLSVILLLAVLRIIWKSVNKKMDSVAEATARKVNGITIG